MTPFHINQNDSAMRIEIMTQADSEDYECMTPRMDQKEIGCQTEKKENEIHIRRSARLAKKRKTMTEMKRKHKEISKGLSSSYLRGSSRRKKE